ncbi:hypothetical protein ACHAW6_010152, partial [Cyclotella cf. meneghiniana]
HPHWHCGRKKRETNRKKITTTSTASLQCTFRLITYCLMDALAGYGSDSDSSEEDRVKNTSSTCGAETLSSLLGNYSDEDEDDGSKKIEDIVDKACFGGVAELTDDQPKKRVKRGDNPNAHEYEMERELPDILPPPRLLTEDARGGDAPLCCNHFQSLTMFPKDYTVQLREQLSSSLKSQIQAKELPKEQQDLREKLDKMFNTFQQHESISRNSGVVPKSFADHLKGQHEFGNPHLLKDIIDHFQINPLESNMNNSFKSFEYVDRLVAAEERSRIAAANHNVNGL